MTHRRAGCELAANGYASVRMRVPRMGAIVSGAAVAQPRRFRRSANASLNPPRYLSMQRGYAYGGARCVIQVVKCVIQK